MRFNLESPCNVASFEVLRCKNVPDDGSAAARATYGFGGDEQQQQREQQLAKVSIKRTAPPIDKAFL